MKEVMMSRYLEIVNLGGDHYLFPFDEISHVKLRSNEIVSIILKTGEIINTRESSENIRFLIEYFAQHIFDMETLKLIKNE
jgi:hypothetical protein